MQQVALPLLVQEYSWEGNAPQLPLSPMDNNEGEELTFGWVRCTPAFLFPRTAFVPCLC